MGEVIAVDSGVWQNGDLYHSSKELIHGILEQITNALYEKGIPTEFLESPQLEVWRTKAKARLSYSRERGAIILPQSYLRTVEDRLKKNDESVREELEFAFGYMYGRHVFNVFCGYQGIDEHNQHLYREFANTFAKWFRDIAFPQNTHVINPDNQVQENSLEAVTRNRLRSLSNRNGLYKTFEGLSDYFFKFYLEDSKPVQEKNKK